MDTVQLGKIYRHFKGNLYQVLCTAKHSETGEELVIYQALYGSFEVYARPKSSFYEKLDRQKYPDAKQEYRFEPVDSIKETGALEASHEQKTTDEREIKAGENNVQSSEEESVPASVIMQFLEARTSEEKLAVLKAGRDKIDERTITNIEVSLDVISDSTDLDDRINYVCDILRTRSKYENTRLR
ncbi:MAG: DUF1653 domain-containing protein [Lachnospiraceae bacterium]|nr:DUF1653 domain-containing protein [Lachnospiraceae bacterium]